MNKITINGKSYSGNNITVENGKVIINGKDITPDNKEINIQIEGNIDILKVDCCNMFSVNGDVAKLSTVSGDVKITGNVAGNIKSVSGNISCGDLSGVIIL